MSVIVKIPTPLRKISNGEAVAQVNGKTVSEVIRNLDKKYAGIYERIYDDEGRLRRFVNVFLNDEDIRFLEGDQTPVKEGDEISIVPAIAGGKSIKKKFYLTFNEETITQPIIWKIGKEFNVITNIRTANVSSNFGVVALEIEGDEKEIEKAVLLMENHGVNVRPIVLDVVEG